VHSILGNWKSIIAGLSSFGESKAIIFLDAVHIRINGESNILKKKKKNTNVLFIYNFVSIAWLFLLHPFL